MYCVITVNFCIRQSTVLDKWFFVRSMWIFEGGMRIFEGACEFQIHMPDRACEFFWCLLTLSCVCPSVCLQNWYIQGSHASINVWECYEIWKKNSRTGNVMEICKISWKLTKCPGKFSSVLKFFGNGKRCSKMFRIHLRASRNSKASRALGGPWTPGSHTWVPVFTYSH